MNIDSMIQGNPQALVTSYNGVLVADSLEVADRFGKAHKNVVRDIENLMDGIEANRLNFEPIAEKEYFIPDFYTDKRFNEVSEEERDLRYKVSSLGNTEALADILGSISKQYDELDNLKRINVVSQTRQLSYEAAGRYVEKCNRELEEAQEELQAAWEAAGGVCPLCGSEVK